MRNQGSSSLRILWATVLIAGLTGSLPGLPLYAQSPAQPTLVWEQTLNGEDDSKLRWPIGVSSAAEDEILVADGYRDRLVLFRKGTGGAGWKAEKVVSLPATPRAVATDGQRYLVALAQAGAVFAVERPTLQLRRLSVPTEVMPGPLSARSDGTIVLVDAATSRILLLAAGGDLQSQIRVTGSINSIAAGSSGDYFVASAQPAEIRRYAGSGELLGSWTPPILNQEQPWPGGIAVESGGTVYVSDRQSGRILALDASSGALIGTGSRRGWESGLLNRPAGLAILGNGRIAVADQGNGRVQIFRQIEQKFGQ